MTTKIPVENLPSNFKSISKLAAWCMKNRIGLYGRNTAQARSKFFEDYKRGVLVAQDPKCITQEEALQYFAVAGLTVIEKGNSAHDGDLFTRKTQAEVRALELRAKKFEFELERERGKYILRAEVELQTAIKINLFEAGFKSMIRTNAADWIYRTGGNAGKANMFCELVYAEVDALLDEFGKMNEIDVIITKDPLPWNPGNEKRAEYCPCEGEKNEEFQHKGGDDVDK